MLVPEVAEVTEAITPESLAEAAKAVFGEAEAPTEPAKATEEPPKAAEPEKPTEEPKDPKEERIAARWNQARKQELRIAQERAELRKMEEAIAKQRAELEPLVKLAEQVKTAKASPTRLLELSGLAPKDFLESLANEHEPQAIAERVKAETSSELEALRKQVAELLDRDRQRESALQRQHIESQVQEAQKAFIDHVAESADKYPHLAEEFTPAEMAREALAVAEKHGQDYYARFGVYPDDEVIAEFLEGQAKARAEERAAWRQRIGKPALVPSKGDSSGEIGKRPTVKADSPRTLTSRAASTKATPPREWSQDEADAEALRILQAAMSKRTA